MELETHGGIYRGPQPGGFVKVGADGGNAEDVRRKLEGGIALGTAPGDPELRDGDAAPFLRAFLALPEGICQSLQNGPVEMGPVVDVGEADDGPLGFRSGYLHPRRPVGLEDQPHGTRRDLPDQVVEEYFGVQAPLPGELLFVVGKLPLEPAYHPVAPVDHDLQAVGPGHGGRIRGDQGDGLDIAPVGGVDSGRGSVTETADMGLQAAGPDDLAGLVRRGGDDGKAGGQPRLPGGPGGDAADFRCRRDELGEHLLPYRQELPFPVPGSGPAETLIVERDVPYLAAGGIAIFPGKTVGEIAGKEEILVGFFPDLPLVVGQPHGLRLGLEVGDGLPHAGETEGHSPEPAQGFQPLGAPLVEPDDGGA